MYNIHYYNKDGDTDDSRLGFEIQEAGMHDKKYDDKYYLYYATSKYVHGKKYPISVQTYIGRIFPDGVVSERAAIDISKTEAATLAPLEFVAHTYGLQLTSSEVLKSIILRLEKGC